MKKVEILAPAGSFASMNAGIKAGCDSVFFGVEQLNMRARSAHNFSIEDFAEISKICKSANVKSYITLNTLLYQHDLTLMNKIIDQAKLHGIDAIIIQDVSAMIYARSVGVSVHASTQLSISNVESVKFFAQFADTIVLAREVDLKMIKHICDKIKEEGIRGPAGELVKIEIFVHGALCIAQSGRCQMSLLQNNTSAQRGACLQECRKKYRVIDDETGKEMVMDNEYIMSPKDLCTLPFLDEIVASGVSVLKIEGRGRSPEYVDTVVKVYREALDAIDQGCFDKKNIDIWMDRLSKVYNRGFTDGYYLGKALPDFSGPSGNKALEEKVFAGLVTHYFAKAKIAEINIQAHEIQKGDRLVIIGNTTGVVYCDVTTIMEDEVLVEKTKKPSLVTIPVGDIVRQNDKVYLIKKKS